MPTAPRSGWSFCPRSPRGVMLLFMRAFVMILIVMFLVRITGTEPSMHHMVVRDEASATETDCDY